MTAEMKLEKNTNYFVKKEEKAGSIEWNKLKQRTFSEVRIIALQNQMFFQSPFLLQPACFFATSLSENKTLELVQNSFRPVQY